MKTADTAEERRSFSRLQTEPGSLGERFAVESGTRSALRETREGMIPEQAIEDSGLAGEAYTNVRNRILRGELAMGQPVSRRKMAAELAMSSVPVSEALLRLQSDGLLESRPRAGTRVRVPTWQDIAGHYVVREALEAKAAMLFAERATHDERSELLKLAIRVDNVGQQRDANRTVYLNLHEKLHLGIAECAGCQTLTNTLSTAAAFASIWEHVLQPDAHGVATHENLMKRLLTADAATAAQSMRDHIRFETEISLRSLRPWFDLQKIPRTYSRKSASQAEEGARAEQTRTITANAR